MTQIGVCSRRVAGTSAWNQHRRFRGGVRAAIRVADNARQLARVIDPVFQSVTRSVPAKGESIAGSPRPVAVSADGVWIADALGRADRSPTAGEPSRRPRSAPSPTASRSEPAAKGQRRHRRHRDADRPREQRGRGNDQRRPERERRRSRRRRRVGTGSGSRTASSGSTRPQTRSRTPYGSQADPARWRSAPAPCGVYGARRGGTVTRIDPTSARVTQTIRLGHSLQGVAVTDEPSGWRSRRTRPRRPRAAHPTR